MCDNLEKARTKAKPLKSDGRYKDAPRFKAIYGYEDEFKSDYRKMIVGFQKELLTAMSKMKP